MADKKSKMPRFSLTWLYLVIAIVLGYLVLNSGGSSLQGGASKEVSYTEFKQYVAQGYASSIVVNKKRKMKKVSATEPELISETEAPTGNMS